MKKRRRKPSPKAPILLNESVKKILQNECVVGRMPSICQGGFCSLVLPHDDGEETINNNNGYTSVFSKRARSLSKGEKRLRRSRQRDRAIRLLQWVLTVEEYSTLENSGDLVTLRVNDTKRDDDDDDDDKEGCWVDEASILLARREHRPELARLAFAEFRSSLGGGGGDCCGGLDGDCAAGGGGGGYANANANTVLEPCSSGSEGDVIVCSNCYNMYGSLRQARALLNNTQERNDKEEEDSADTFEPREAAVSSSSEIVSTTQQKDALSPSKKAVSQKESSYQMHTQSSSTNPSQSQHDDDNPKPKKKKKKRSKRRKRNRKQLEENSKVHILVVEADEVRLRSAKLSSFRANPSYIFLTCVVCC